MDKGPRALQPDRPEKWNSSTFLYPHHPRIRHLCKCQSGHSVYQMEMLYNRLLLNRIRKARVWPKSGKTPMTRAWFLERFQHKRFTEHVMRVYAKWRLEQLGPAPQLPLKARRKVNPI